LIIPSTLTGDLYLSSDSSDIGLISVDQLYTDQASFLLLTSPTTVGAFTGATSLVMGATTGVSTIRNDLTIEGNDLNLAQSTAINYSENNDRANRPEVKSTTGNSSGFRVLSPNSTTSANANLTVFGSDDINNGEFMSIQASGSTTAPFTIRTGKYTAGVLGASGEEINFIDNATTYASINPAGPTNSTDLTTKAYVDALPANITYTIDASTTTGGANFNLVGSDSTTDTVKFASGTNVTVSRTDANTITIAATDTNTTYDYNATSTTGGANLNLVGSDSTTDTVKLSNGTGVTVSQVSGTEVSVAIGQAVGTSDDVQFNSVRTPTINANGGVSFVDTNVGGSTYATVNPFGPTNSTDLTTVFYVNSILPTVVTYTQDVSSTTGGANLNLVGSNSTTDSVKFAGGTNVSVVATDANTITISSTDTNTTYTQDVSSTTGGANLNLVGSDSTTDSVKFAGGTNVSVVATDASTMTINATDTNTTYDFAASSTTGGANLNLTGSDSTTDTVKLTNGGGITATYTSATEVTLGSTATSANTASAIVARDASGNFSAGTITANLANGSRVLGSLTATPSTTYTFPAPALTSITDNNGIDAVSSYNNSSSSLGNGAQGQFTHYFGDTFAGPNTAPVFSLRSANGNSELTGTIPFTGLSPVAPSAVTSTNILGGLNFNGYATTGFTEYIATQNQGGGFTAVHAGQIQFAPAETFADGTLTISGATITAVSRVNVAQTVTSVSGTRGQLTIPSTLAGVGTAVVVTGTLTGTATGISAGTYYIVANNGGAGNSTSITLSATVGGAPITTTAGTTTGLTFTRQLITVTYSAQSYIPFGTNAKIAVSGFTNVSTGTFMVVGAPTTTSVTIGATSSGVPALSGSQSLSLPTVTAGAATFRVRGFPAATPLNNQNRVDIINASAAAATFRSNTYTFNTGAYGNTGVGVTGNNISYNRVYGQFAYSTTITPGAANTAAAFPLGTADVSNIATVGSTSRLIPGAAGAYNMQFSVQVDNADNGNDHIAYIWLRKNGTDVTNSMGQVTVVKGAATIASWNYLISSANTTDYWELMYAVSDTNITFPTFAATAFGPSTATIITTLTPVGA